MPKIRVGSVQVVTAEDRENPDWRMNAYDAAWESLRQLLHQQGRSIREVQTLHCFIEGAAFGTTDVRLEGEIEVPET